MIILSSPCVIEDDPPLQNHSRRREVFHQSEVTAQVLWRVETDKAEGPEQTAGQRKQKHVKMD